MPVDWDVLAQHNTFQTKMLPWITKKVTEYFGEAEETVISFVMEEVRRPKTKIPQKHRLMCADTRAPKAVQAQMCKMCSDT
eukprot:COSAG01_NODE_495_length_16308_cov_92.317088_23_plen_81_part_00